MFSFPRRKLRQENTQLNARKHSEVRKLQAKPTRFTRRRLASPPDCFHSIRRKPQQESPAPIAKVNAITLATASHKFNDVKSERASSSRP
jgi:hypothetical protein